MDAVTTRDIVALVNTTPVLVITDPKARDELFTHIRAEIAAFKPDLTTGVGRKAIASLAFKVSRTKTAVDEAGEKLIEEHRAIVAAVNADRKTIRETLDGLRDEARKPLDDWEEAEAMRAQKVRDTVELLRKATIVPLGMTAEAVGRRIAEMGSLVFEQTVFLDEFENVSNLRMSVITALKSSFNALTVAEAEKAELDALRAKEAEKAAADKKAAEDKAAEGARTAATAKQELDAANARADAAMAAAAKLQRADEVREAQDKLAADAAADRQSNVEHRKKVVDEAALTIAAAGSISIRQGKTIVLAILARQIPNVTLNF